MTILLADPAGNQVLNAQVINTVDSIYTNFSNILNTLVIAIIIFFMGFIIGRIVGKLITRILKEVQINELSAKFIKGRLSLDQFLGNTISYAIYFVFIVITLDYLKIGKPVLQILLTFIFIILTVSLILSLRDFFPNFLAGLTLMTQRRIKVGDKIEVMDIYGKIESVGLLSTKIQTFKREIIYIPNSIFLKQKLKKFVENKKEE